MELRPGFEAYFSKGFYQWEPSRILRYRLKRGEQGMNTRQADIRLRIAAPIFPLIGPMVRFLLRRGLGEPNVLLTVRGRRSGRPRTVPVAMFELQDRRFLEASLGEVGWVRNLRAAGEAIIARGRWSQTVRTVELSPDDAGQLVHDALCGFRRRPLLKKLLGPSVRPPAVILHRYHLRIDDELEDYVAHARRCPMFEVFPADDQAGERD